MANIDATLLFNFYKVHLHLDDSVISVSLLFVMSMLFVHTARAVCSSLIMVAFCGLSKLSSSWENCFVD